MSSACGLCVVKCVVSFFSFFFSSRRRHTRWNCDWSSDVCSSDLCEWWKAQRFSFDSAGTQCEQRNERASIGSGIPPGDGHFAATICRRAADETSENALEKGGRRDHSTL